MLDMNSLPRRHVALVVGVVLTVKLAYLLEYSNLPFMQAPLFDSLFYLKQARAVLHGQGAGPALFSPSPMYSYFLALLGGGMQPVLPIFVQLLLGCLNLALILRLSAERFSMRAGLFSAGLYLGYGPLLFYESKLLPETLSLTLVIVATSLYLSPSFQAGGWRRAVLCGAVLGLCVLSWVPLVVSVPLFALLAFLPSGKRDGADQQARTRRGLGCVLGMGFVLALQGLWMMGTSLPDQKGPSRRPVAAIAVAEAPLSGPAAPAVADPASPVAGHPSLDLALSRLSGLFMNIEGSHFQYSYYGERDDLSIYQVLPVSFGMILLFAALGAGFLYRDEGTRALLPYLPLLIGPMVAAAAFLPGGRQRLALLVPLLLLAGCGLDRVLLCPLTRPRVLFSILVGVSGIALMWRSETHEMRDPAAYEIMVAQSAVRAGLFDDALDRINRARALAPGDPNLERTIREVVGIHQRHHKYK
jgi:hypothetical protein